MIFYLKIIKSVKPRDEEEGSNWEVPQSIRWNDLQRKIIDFTKELIIPCESCAASKRKSDRNGMDESDSDSEENDDESDSNSDNVDDEEDGNCISMQDNSSTKESNNKILHRNYLFVEGFLLFYPPLIPLFDKKIFLCIGKETCYNRRMATTRVAEGYFQKLLWPGIILYLISYYRIPVI